MSRTRLRAALGVLGLATVGFVLSVMVPGAVAVDLPAASLLTTQGRGALRLEVVDGDTGRALAARARIVPSRLWRDERVLIDRKGQLLTALAPGSYRVSVTHGPEWSVSEQTVQIEQGAETRLSVELVREVDASAYTGCDLHVHTAESPDSNLALEDRVSTLLAEDVQFAILTDHNRVTDAVQQLAHAGIASVPGVEVTTWAPELGHFNVFPRRTAPRYRHENAHRLLRELRKDPTSFVQINHPRLEGHIGYFELAAFERARAQGGHAFPLAFDGIEIWNGYDLAQPGRRDEVFHDWLALVEQGQHITATGNSDSHRAGVAPYVGYPRTYVSVPRTHAQLAERVVSALKSGRAFVTNGPIITLRVEGREPGETVQLARLAHTVRVRVDVAAPAWMELSEIELWLGANRVLLRSVEPLQRGREGRASVALELPVRDERSLVATVRGLASMKPLLGRAQITPYAFTNPVWLTRR